MIYCLSCRKYPVNTKVIPYGSTFPIDTFTVKLITKNKPSNLKLDGSDVENLADTAKFAVGSTLYVISEDKEYIYFEDEFVAKGSSGGGGGDSADKSSPIVGVGQVGYMKI